LVRSRRDRDEARSFVVEGPTLVAEALAAGITIDALYLSEDHQATELADALTDSGGDVWTLDPGVLASIASTESPRPVLATAAFVDVDLDTALDQASDRQGAPLVVVAAGVGEPGNLGTIVRSALGAGATAVVTCDGAVDLYNPKVVRAAAGALFRIPVVRDADVAAVAAALASRSIRSLGLDAGGTVSIDAVDLTVAVAIVVGNEAHGLSPQARDCLDDTVSIPLQGGLESLNAASALTVTCFEAARQRRLSRRAPVL
jgi:RNA methyltransferase, TrmH family